MDKCKIFEDKNFLHVEFSVVDDVHARYVTCSEL